MEKCWRERDGLKICGHLATHIKARTCSSSSGNAGSADCCRGQLDRGCAEGATGSAPSAQSGGATFLTLEPTLLGPYDPPHRRICENDLLQQPESQLRAHWSKRASAWTARHGILNRWGGDCAVGVVGQPRKGLGSSEDHGRDIATPLIKATTLLDSARDLVSNI